MSGMLRFCLENKLVVALLVGFVVVWGVVVAPFDWEIPGLVRAPVPTDAIPDLGDNQQIVFTDWMGRSPQDVEDQITYPLTVSLLGIPGVRTIRSFSFFGFSQVLVIFEEGVDFYWSRSRVLEKLASLPAGTLPPGVAPALGPDATAMGQVFWYTIEGRDPQGRPAGGWDLHELRSVQDWTVRYALNGVQGVSEVASVGGFVQEYQIDVDPDAMRVAGVTLAQVFAAVRMSNLDVGARTIEVNRVEYVIRGLGFIKDLRDIEESVVRVADRVPIRIKDVAKVSLGPALRRGVLDKEGSEAVGGVVVARYGANPLETIKRVKEKIAEISTGLPRKVLPDGTVSQLTIVPFYDRSGLIYETLGTLNEALSLEILVTAIVVITMVAHLRSSLLISGLLPLTVLMTFIGMKHMGVDANIVALSGIAIAIGTVVDMGIVLCENVLRHLHEAGKDERGLDVIHRATMEVAGAVLTAIATTVVSFLPVFTMEAAEGRLFKPLAWTKSMALLASVIVALVIIPPAAHLLFGKPRAARKPFEPPPWMPSWLPVWGPRLGNAAAAVAVALLLSRLWLPLGPARGELRNLLFVGALLGGLLGGFALFHHFYRRILIWCLDHKAAFLALPLAIVILGGVIWQGLGREFMPPLDEGSFLYMPSTMPHASIGESTDMLSKQDLAIRAIPEVESVVGKIGRVESPLDPAPIAMVETIVLYKPEYVTDKDGHRLRFAFDPESGEYLRDEKGELVPDPSGRPYRQWRDHIRSPDDIWTEIARVAQTPGATSAPQLQPIAARIVMLQSGMRAPMGLKVYGPDLKTIERVGLAIEGFLKQVPAVRPETVFADRIVGKPYIEIDIDRQAIARYGIMIQQVQDVIEVAIGGKRLTTTVEGRERYPVRVRYQRELRDQVEQLGRILVAAADGAQIPLSQLAEIRYVRGPQAIKSEDTFLTGYVIFDKKTGYAEVDVVEACDAWLKAKVASGELEVPPGVHWKFSGTYENQLRATKRMALVLPAALFAIFLLIYLQFRSTAVTFLVFTGVFMAWAGGFLMLWFYGQPWFLDFSVFGVSMRETFQVHPINLSVAVWVGFLALFGIATDDGVIMATYIGQTLGRDRPRTVEGVRAAVLEAGQRRVRPCLMTTATTILALLPVLTSTGRGADMMVPMAIPSFGGMTVELITMFVVPTLYCLVEELKLKWRGAEALD